VKDKPRVIVSLAPGGTFLRARYGVRSIKNNRLACRTELRKHERGTYHTRAFQSQRLVLDVHLSPPKSGDWPHGQFPDMLGINYSWYSERTEESGVL
jgi:hypothetical protein